MSAVLSRNIEPVEVQDFSDFSHLMPETALLLVQCMEIEATVALLNAWPGVEVKVPRFPNANPAGARRWAQLAALVGETAMQKLAALYGGTVLEIPLCSRVRLEKRNRNIRSEFDQLTAKPPTGEGLSKAEAVQEIGMRHAPISVRLIGSILSEINR
ncbi:Mor transcription activator family protein [Diaphorobacter caeni]|uniref:Mor transcription activator family protein n=1 Tax=Diaphorobacter caeni TaxID=2784387 RepID=UPI0018907E6A|nr:Mor transcription activator family protein [Diaphorobacter caeni]MBF5004714.1 hypothetical protein [Diaphorobacter caeni]